MTNTTPSAAWWKKLLVVGVASGAAFALVLCVAVGAILWFQSRPKPWNTEAVKASYATLEFLMDSDSFVVELGYDLQNNTIGTTELTTATLSSWRGCPTETHPLGILGTINTQTQASHRRSCRL